MKFPLICISRNWLIDYQKGNRLIRFSLRILFLMCCLDNQLSCVVIDYRITQRASLYFQELLFISRSWVINYPKLQILSSSETGCLELQSTFKVGCLELCVLFIEIQLFVFSNIVFEILQKWSFSTESYRVKQLPWEL